MKQLKWLLRWNNIRIAPIVLLVRVPIMLVGMTIERLGECILKIGSRIPGWREFP